MLVPNIVGVLRYMLLAFQVIGLALRGDCSVGLILGRSKGVGLGLFSVVGRLGLGYTA